jgi:CheY-like chemotaxis protein
MNFEQDIIRPRPISVLLALPGLEPAIACRSGLAARNCFVHLVYDGSEVVEALGRFRPDVILLDAGLAASHQAGIREAIERQPASRRIPMILLAEGGVEQGQVVQFGANAVMLASSPAPVLYRAIVRCLAQASCAA